ncbi:MAG TPA: PepSY-associated TM helix domain-containing protein [Fibrobacteria bacterium]|nr:PepSY-associated TM helix domain-containing protein [Fibrobacteria bacterium]
MVRKTLFWIHLAAGLLAALPLAAMALTGILLSFEHQIVEAMRTERSVNAIGVRLPLDSVVTRAAGTQASRVTAVSWTIRPGSPVELRLGREDVLRADPVTGDLLGRTTVLEKGFATVEILHRWLGSKEIGGKITGVSVLLCLVLSTTGLFLWWPRSLRALRGEVWPRRGLRGQARDWQWHNAVGALVLPGLVVLTLTGTVMSWKWAEGLLYAAAGSKSPRPQMPSKSEGAAKPVKDRPGPDASSISEDRNWQEWSDTLLAHAPAGWTSVRVAAPTKPGSGASGVFRTSFEPVPSGGIATLALDGSFQSWAPAGKDPCARLRSLVKPLHTGELFGVAGQIFFALVSLGTLVLVWTGVVLSGRRFARSRSS